MDENFTKKNITEMLDNICLFANRLISIIKYINCAKDMNSNDRSIIIDFLDEIAGNIKIEIENLKHY